MKHLTKEEERELFHTIRESSDSQAIARAKDRIVLSNMGLVAKEANRFARLGSISHTADDLLNDGVIGLYDAIDRFDVGHGTRFTSYAHAYIRKRLFEAINNRAYLVRVPIHKIFKGHERHGILSINRDLINGSQSDLLPQREERGSLYDDEEVDIVFSAMKRLPEKEQFVLRQMYLEGRSGASIARETKVSKERIRQIKETALLKLRRKLRKTSLCR